MKKDGGLAEKVYGRAGRRHVLFVFATTKYSCIKCGHSVCNCCSVFKDDEGTPGWVAGKSVGYCISCEKEEGASTNNRQEEKANSG